MSTKKRNRSTKDPQAAREAQRYEFPVPSREAILDYLAQTDEPLSYRALAAGLEVENERDQQAFTRRLRAMERDGQLLKNRKGRYGLTSRMDMVRGRIVGHADGFGFLIPEQGGEDLFISPRDMRQVLHGDRVLARVTGVDSRGRREGAIVEVLERQHSQIVGRYTAEGRIGLVVPDEKRITQDVFIPEGEQGEAKSGQIVIAEILEQPTRHTQPVGKIIEVLGDHMAPGMEVEIAIRKHELPYEWPAGVRDQVAGIPAQVRSEDKRNREDLRELPLVTIDGEDAQDFDDAVYCEQRGKDWRLIVAIADVSHYVHPASDLDGEAFVRGNSVYFPGRVIPMLPEELSNGLCSLNPRVDRLCMVCDMDLGAGGKIKSHRFYEAVMRSHARLTYNEVAAMVVDDDRTLQHKYKAVFPHLEDLYRLYKVLRGARARRGAFDLDLPETRIVFDAQRRIDKIVPVERNDAHRLIEECMLAANVCAAELLAGAKVPGLYRIHEGPSAEKLESLRQMLFEVGLRLTGGDEPEVKDYAKLMEQLGGRADENLIKLVLLRSLSQAVYSPDNVGHFALGYVNYTHFTSPIRRYPDLVIHRLIKRIVAGKKLAGEEDAVARVGEHCSMTERRADDATRDVADWLKAEFMMDRVGEEFDATISGVTNFGVFVQLTDVFVEGLVHVTALGNDYYHFDAATHRLMGERSKTTYRLGDAIKVRLVRVDLDEAQLDFELAGSPPATGRGPKSARGRKRKGKKQAKRAKAPGKAVTKKKRSPRRRKRSG